MRSWNYAINSIYKTGHVTLIHAPFWVFWAETLFDNLCNVLPFIKFPPIGHIEDEGETYNWHEWYGDLHQWFHGVFHSRIQHWLWKKQTEYHIQVDYNVLRELFYEPDKTFWDECEQDQLS